MYLFIYNFIRCITQNTKHKAQKQIQVTCKLCHVCVYCYVHLELPQIPTAGPSELAGK